MGGALSSTLKSLWQWFGGDSLFQTSFCGVGWLVLLFFLSHQPAVTSFKVVKVLYYFLCAEEEGRRLVIQHIEVAALRFKLLSNCCTGYLTAKLLLSICLCHFYILNKWFSRIIIQYSKVTEQSSPSSPVGDNIFQSYVVASVCPGHILYVNNFYIKSMIRTGNALKCSRWDLKSRWGCNKNVVQPECSTNAWA